MTIVDFLSENAPAILAWLNGLVAQAPYIVFVAPLAAVFTQAIKAIVRSRGQNLDGMAGWIQLGLNALGILVAWLLVRSAQSAGASEQEAADLVENLFNVVTNGSTLIFSVIFAGALSRGVYRYGKQLEVFRDWKGATGA